MTTTSEALAKVNFTLEVLGKRVDGYHALRSVVVPVSLSDTVEIDDAPPGVVESDTGFADDLCVKAAKTLGCDGVRIRVAKRIPAGGGLGGGSADAAAVLWALNGMRGQSLSAAELADVGARVGSDVPALVLSRACGPVLMEGRGEVVKPVFERLGPEVFESHKTDSAPGDLRTPAPQRPHTPTLHLVLVNPGVFSSTPKVFRACSPRLQDDPSILYNMRTALESGDVVGVASCLMNDLQAPAEAIHPEIAEARRALADAGALGATMSGSGSTVFGLVPDEARGREIAALLEAKGYMAWSVRTVCPVV